LFYEFNRKDSNRSASILLKGFVYAHEDMCDKADCSLKIYMQNLTSLLKDKKKKTSSKIGQYDNYGLLLGKLFLKFFSKLKH
jgi:hypothetical protein